MNLFDQFLATQGRMAQNDAQSLENRANLMKIGEMERAQKQQAETLAYYKKPVETTLANISEIKEVPDAGAESVGLRQMGEAPKVRSAAEQLMDAAKQEDKAAKELLSINPAEAEKRRKERDNILVKAAPLLKEERLSKIEENKQVMNWMGAVKDEPSFQSTMAQIRQFKPEMYKAWTEMKLPNGEAAFERNLDGSFAYTPKTQKIVETVAKASVDEVQREQIADRVADNKRADLEFEIKKKDSAEKERHNKATEGLARENRQAKADAPAKMPKAPVGYRYTEDGALEFIPGGPQDPKNKTTGTKDVQQLSKALESAKLPVASSVLDAAEKLVSANPKMLEFATGPGMLLPDRAVPKEARDVRQAIEKVFNIELQDRSGAAVTSQELARLKSEYGKGAFKTSEQVQNALKQARAVITDHYRSVAAGFGPKALTDYNENLKALGGSPVIELGAKAGGIPAIKGDADYAALPSGSQYIAPDGSTRTKK